MNVDRIIKDIQRLHEQMKVNDKQLVKIVVSRDVWEKMVEEYQPDESDYMSPSIFIAKGGVEIRVDDVLPKNSYWPFRRKDLTDFEKVYMMNPTLSKMPG